MQKILGNLKEKDKHSGKRNLRNSTAKCNLQPMETTLVSGPAVLLCVPFRNGKSRNHPQIYVQVGYRNRSSFVLADDPSFFFSRGIEGKSTLEFCQGRVPNRFDKHLDASLAVELEPSSAARTCRIL